MKIKITEIKEALFEIPEETVDMYINYYERTLGKYDLECLLKNQVDERICVLKMKYLSSTVERINTYRVKYFIKE